ncbi:hypothetical protein A2803_03895 [Candidatus Woesebacteria bacterium RIFCSPHIGHO2_01_FULL_44_21]|uniref:Glycosyltransferase RgtA/B/C/D-like domain-containing protein n=1 Tax=Candidatus Woesebacteria bacterium RIFCSPHIGHO2_01_FULL_44_21 TaxID=1802503 RepID=A0A1F7YX67_9BACT|nr:MAG: hypothetical protein A2803_03895 [Candidatus Woesebacteria bacterium RIFCSPHIGHO2_01_FULL_44_21]
MVLNMFGKDKIYINLLALIAFVIVLVWFRNGELIAGGEEGLWTYDALRASKLYSYGWSSIYGYIPLLLPRTPVLLFVGALQQIINPLSSQMFLFFLLIFCGLAGMYFFVREFVKSEKIVALLASLFYFFNLFVMTQIWNRNIYAGYFTWSYLPIFLVVWLRWLRTKKIIFLLLILLSSLVFSTAFTTLAFLFTLWIPVGVLTLTELFKKLSDKREAISVLSLAVLAVILWLVSSAWWIWPIFTNTYNIQTILDFNNFEILKGVSQYFRNADVLLLRQSYYFNEYFIFNDSYKTEFYLSYQSYIVSILILGVVVVGALSSFGKEYFKFLVILFVLGWFVSKGSNPPLGLQIYGFLFSNFIFTQMLRNPYEKLGLILVFPYSIFFSLGTYWLWKHLKKYGRLVIVFFLFLVYGLLVNPMWSGQIYSKIPRLRVPDTYSKVNSIINQDKSDLRILSLPVATGESIDYVWGYKGVIPLELLFDKTIIVWPVIKGSEYVDLLALLQKGDLKGLHRAFDILNIKYLILHHEIEPDFPRSQEPEDIANLLSQDSEISLVVEKDFLSLYEYKSLVPSRFIASKNGPKISYVAKDKVNYKVRVDGATGPYELIFKDRFHPKWEAIVDGQRIDDHFLAYDYANGWKIDKIGSYEVDIIFKVWPWQ